MKALIFNSGLGSRLGSLTAENPKAMVRLASGEAIFERQLRILCSCGVTDFVITTGPFEEQLRAVASRYEERGYRFSFVRNADYAATNYIYSMYLAREHLRGDSFLVLHGDLVFDAGYAQMVIDSELPSLGSVNQSLPLPEKDFKARIVEGDVREVSVKIFCDDCVAFQPFYKLSESSMGVWLDAVERFVEAGDTSVYAENAANEVLDQMGVKAFSYEGHFVEEVDTPEDLARVSAVIGGFDFAQQPVYEVGREDEVTLAEGSPVGELRSAASLAQLLGRSLGAKPLVVAGGRLGDYVEARGLGDVLKDAAVFSGYSPNPSFGEVVAGVEAYRSSGCDSVLVVGGGSAIDVAKCVKAFATSDLRGDPREVVTHPRFSDIPLVAIPTTAGTGSESTHFAVCYVDGAKRSVSLDCLQPNVAVLDATNLKTLPDYQKKCTMLDALCQAVESHWSVRSCPASREYSSRAIEIIIANADAYLSGDSEAAREVMRASNLAGKAINLTTTTAAHAMSYKLTSMFGLPHGHAVAVCMPHVWAFLLDNTHDKTTEERLSEIAELMGGCAENPKSGLEVFEKLVGRTGIDEVVDGLRENLEDLVAGVNMQRLGNYPIKLSKSDIRGIYSRVLGFNR